MSQSLAEPYPVSIDPVVFVHPMAICEACDVGAGTRIWAYAHVLDGAIVGRDCNIGDHAYIEGGARVGHGVTVKNRVLIWEGVTIEDGVFLGPGMTFVNDSYPRSRHLPEAAEFYRCKNRWLVETTVRTGASIGAAAVVLGGVTIGRYASVGAGAVVTRDIPDHAVFVGNPARHVGWACVCGVPLSDQFSCPRCERAYELSGGLLRQGA